MLVPTYLETRAAAIHAMPRVGWVLPQIQGQHLYGK
jgi:hypothetical protein